MALESRLELKLTQKLVLTPQLQMAIKLLQMPQLELSQAINQELVENPLLEEIVDYSGSEGSEEMPSEERETTDEGYQGKDDSEMPLEKLIHFSTDDYFEERSSDGRDLGYFAPDKEEQPSFENFLGTGTTLYDHLLWQLRLSKEDPDIRSVAEVIIGNIDENGYLRITHEEIRDITKADRNTIERALSLVQSFDPAGIAASDIKECLQLQLKALGLQETLVEKLVINNLDQIGKRKYAQLAGIYNVSIDDIMAAVKIIEGLDPKPGRNFSSSSTNYVTPDVYIYKTDEGYQIVLNDEGLPKLRLNSFYQRLLKNKNSINKEEKQFLEEKLRSAVWLMKSLDQRNRTIYKVTENILKYQRDFFDKGVSHLKPLNLKDIAIELNLHESTISRVTSNKYLSCPHGIFSFKYFFSNAIPSEAGDLSSTSVKEMIRKIISEEDRSRPLSDIQIAKMLANKNITIARRTIAKYREEMKIPAQNQRKR